MPDEKMKVGRQAVIGSALVGQ
ncbi:hypothetical protein AGR9A_Lc40746 [Agrobacterium salinitolerans str. Hayward 0363]|nr:hypothetical protein AGR9A_Lc40746 [Agrobacterium salinitolerans str. Hayward 0363]